MKRQEILKQLEHTICRDRVDTHGKPENTFALIADYWSTYLSQEAGVDVLIDASDVAVMMSLFKIARFQVQPMHMDNAIDGAGYFVIAGELVSEINGSDELLNER